MSSSSSVVAFPVLNGNHLHASNGKPPKSAPPPSRNPREPPTGTHKSETGSFTSKFCFLSWNEDETHSIREFIRRYPLPRVVRVTNVEETSIIKALKHLLPPDVDISQPILLYKKYRPIKIQGRCLKVQKNGKLKFVGGGSSGSSFILPDSFPGWFSLLTPDGKECAMTLTSMGQIAAARVPAFLTKFDVPVYKLTESHEAGVQSVYVRSSARPGSVLRLLGIWADLGPGGAQHHSHSLNPHHYAHAQGHGQFSSSYFGTGGSGPAANAASRARSLSGFGGRLVARSLSAQPPQGPPQFQYIQCLNQENEVLFVPFTATGVFYPIAPRGGRNPQHIYPLAAVARLQRLPARVKMVFGALPPNLPDFSGTFELENVTTDDVILACTLLKDKPTLFELDPASDLFLSQMNSDDLFIKSASYQSALNHCRAEGEAWRRSVKPTAAAGAAGGTVKEKNRTITAAVLKKSLRLRGGSSNTTTVSPFAPFLGSGNGNGGSPPYTSPAVSKLSQLFRPNSFGPPPTRVGSTEKNGLKRSKSFNIETQCVSLSLAAQDELGQQQQRDKPREPEPGKRLSSIFSFMSGSSSSNRKYGSEPKKEQSGIRVGNQYTSTEFLSSARARLQLHSANAKNRNCNGEDDIPYGRVVDEVTGGKKAAAGHRSDEGEDEGNGYESENIYAEIPGDELLKLNANLRLNFHLRDGARYRHSILVEGMHGHHHHQLHHHHNGGSSNMSSLIKGGGGSDGAFSGGTFSSSNPSSTEEDIYDNIF